MRRGAALLALGIASLGLAGCATLGGIGADASPDAAPAGAAAGAGAPETGAPESGGGFALPAPRPGAATSDGGAGPGAGPEVGPEDVRDIHLALEGEPGGTISVIFAIDRNANGDPTDESALRLSPEGGACNPQELSSYRFPGGSMRVFGLDEARRGITPGELPRFLAAGVTEAMLRDGLAATREDTFAQNVCTRKLWEVLIANQRAREQAAGQL